MAEAEEKNVYDELDDILAQMLKLINESGRIGFGPGSEEARMAHQKKCDALLRRLEALRNK